MIETEALFRIADAAENAGDHDLARRSFERCAALGDTGALVRLAYIHDEGIGVPVDKSLAMRLYQRAWRRDKDAAAANNIAILYRDKGRFRAMFRWFRRTAEAGDGGGHLDMAKCYLDGSGVRKNLQLALRHLAVAAGSDDITEYEREQAQALLKTLAPRSV
ncbi:tetratricopeptide repeat protein [Brevundimonas faecalis]|uniref:tetratricopeptide repeat protein n=1 Tax=Brevundimonas faecalis TaxID=947378 RepID=UPI00339472E6